MTSKEVKVFLNSHRICEMSAARFEYSRFLYKEFDRCFFGVLDKLHIKDVDKQIALQISEANAGEELVRLMRKEMPVANKYELRQKLLANEEIVITLIQEKCISNRQDYFIENALDFFLHCKANVSDWFVENYELFKSEYLKSMFCLILGFRSEKELIPFLISEAERLERLYPDEPLDQGPTMAVHEQAYRFLGISCEQR